MMPHFLIPPTKWDQEQCPARFLLFQMPHWKHKEWRESFFATSNIPFLSVFAGNDPVTNGIEKDVLRMAPNAISAPHIGGGHFYQWTRPEKLSGILADFINE